MKVSFWFLLLVAYIVFFAGILLNDVGEYHPAYTFEYIDVLTMIWLFGFPAWFGYMIGKSEADNK